MSEAPKKDTQSEEQIIVNAFTALELSSRRDSNSSFKIVVGAAELGGTPLRPNVDYPLDPDAEVTLFSWKGCVVEITGEVKRTPETHCPQGVILKHHALLELERIKAEDAGQRGPRVMVIGGYDCGKTSVVRALLNYAVQIGRTPIFVSLDVRHGDLGVPGTLGAVVVDKVSDDKGRFGDFRKPPLMYHFGHAYIDFNKHAYNVIVGELSKNVLAAMDSCPSTKSSGLIIDTNGDTDDRRHIQHAAMALEVSHVLVIENEQLYNDAVRYLPPFVNICYLPPILGVRKRTKRVLHDAADLLVGQYFGTVDFHGNNVPADKSGPVVIQPVDSVKICEMAEDRRSHKNNEIRLSSKRLGELEHDLLGISSSASKEDAGFRNILGYVAVSKVDRSKDEIHLKTPGPKELPGKILLVSDGTMSKHRAKVARGVDLGAQDHCRALNDAGFPKCVREALDILVSSPTGSLMGMNPSLDYVFYDVNPRDGERRPLSAIRELIVLNELRDFFCNPPLAEDAPTRNLIFMTLFQHPSDKRRVSMLSRLTSIGISLRLVPILDSTAVLLGQTGSSSKLATKVIDDQVREFVYLLPDPALGYLKELRNVSQFFAGHFIGVLGHLYSGKRRRESSHAEFGDEIPPTVLIEVLTTWIRSAPEIPVLPMITKWSKLLPPGGIVMPASSPLAAMFRWSIVSPLVIKTGPNSDSWRWYSEWDFRCRDCVEFAWSKLEPETALQSKEVISIIVDLADCFQHHWKKGFEEAGEMSFMRLATLVKLCLDKGYFLSSKGTISEIDSTDDWELDFESFSLADLFEEDASLSLLSTSWNTRFSVVGRRNFMENPSE
ncbi:unnamed protein product [Notodromas monacha]|uniref:Protein CLP1 homolog n=1 Tax=Notodromas monacha TaxID=399045 RepID=A0A7R9BJE0_9CRUS|nr:unnamed protein product [Notodromas monacha]CAG0916596.1 unnamed protein product [Notodromas monacha]